MIQLHDRLIYDWHFTKCEFGDLNVTLNKGRGEKGNEMAHMGQFRKEVKIRIMSKQIITRQ